MNSINSHNCPKRNYSVLEQVVKGFNLFYCTRRTLESVFIIGKKCVCFFFISSILTGEPSLEEFQSLLSILHSYEVGVTSPSFLQ